MFVKLKDNFPNQEICSLSWKKYIIIEGLFTQQWFFHYKGTFLFPFCRSFTWRQHFGDPKRQTFETRFQSVNFKKKLQLLPLLYKVTIALRSQEQQEQSRTIKLLSLSVPLQESEVLLHHYCDETPHHCCVEEKLQLCERRAASWQSRPAAVCQWSFKLHFFSSLMLRQFYNMSYFSCLELKNDLLNWQTSHSRHNLNRITKYIVPIHSLVFKFSWNKVPWCSTRKGMTSPLYYCWSSFS